MIANISTIGFGAYDRYRSKVHPKGDNLNKFVEDNVREAAKDLEIIMIIGIKY